MRKTLCAIIFCSALALQLSGEAQTGSKILPGINWTLIGPGMGGNSFWLTVDPNNDNVLYYSPDVGGLYKSVDGGKNWLKTAVSFLHENRGGITCLTTVAPSNSKVVYSASTLRYCDYLESNKGKIHKPEEKELAQKYGTSECGLFKTADAGETWTAVTGSMPRLGAIAIDPEDENTIWTAAPGFDVFEVKYFPTYSPLGEGVVSRSSDGGKTWQHSYAGCKDKTGGAEKKVAFGFIAVDPSSPKGKRTLYVSGNQGVYKSEDGGAAWREVNNGLPHKKAEQMTLFYDKQNKKTTLYVSLNKDGGKGGGVYKSEDGGANWKNISGNLDSKFGYRKVTADPVGKGVCYVAQMYPGSGIFKTSDDGKTWQRINYAWGPQRNKDMDLWNLSSGYGDRLESEIAISRQNPERIYYADGACSMYKTENGGKYWEQIYTNKIGEHNFQTRGMDNTFIMDIAVSPKNPKNIYMAEHDFGMLSSFDGGKSWENAAATGINKACGYVQPIGCGTYSLAVDPENPDFVCAGIKGWANESDNGLFCISKDGGHTWSKPDNPAGAQQGNINDLVKNPNSKQKQYLNRPIYSIAITKSGRILITKRTGLFYSDDRGSSWKKAETGLPDNNEYMFYKLLASGKKADRIYAICSLFPVKDGIPQPTLKTDGKINKMLGGLYVSDDNGAHWKRLSENIAWANPASLAVAEDENTIYMGLKSWLEADASFYPGGLYKSQDGGRTWTEIIKCRNRPEANVTAVAVNRKYPNIVYAVVLDMLNMPGLSGIYRSIDAGKTWQDVSGLASHHAQCHCLLMSPHDPSVLFVGTNGSGAYTGVDEYVKSLEKQK